MSPSNGPYLSYAVVCEKMLREADNVVSLIRIIDRVTVLTTVSNPAPLVAVTFAGAWKLATTKGPTLWGGVLNHPPAPIGPTLRRRQNLRGTKQETGWGLGLK